MQSENQGSRKLLYILLALVVAASIWFYVDEGQTTEKTFTDIPISYIGESGLGDRGLMLLEENTSTSVDLTISCGRRLISTLEREDIRVTVDLNNVSRAGLQSVNYRIAFSNSDFSEDMIKSRSSSYVFVNISELNSKEVEIRCELVGNLAEGCSAGQLQLSQETLEIRGLPEDVDPVSYAKVTLDIGEEAAESVSKALAFQYFDENDRLVSGGNIHPAVETVQATLPVFVTKELRLVMGFTEAPGLRRRNLDYEIKPRTITVSGDASTLRDVETITLGQLDLLELRGRGFSSYTYPIIIPEGCQNLSGVTQATIEIDFKDMTTARVAVENIGYTNLPDGKNIELLTAALNITIYGTSADVAAVTGEHITVTADLANYAAASGTYTVPVEVEVTAPVDVGIDGTYEVQVSIREPEEEESPDAGENPDDQEASGPADLTEEEGQT